MHVCMYVCMRVFHKVLKHEGEDLNVPFLIIQTDQKKGVMKHLRVDRFEVWPQQNFQPPN